MTPPRPRMRALLAAERIGMDPNDPAWDVIARRLAADLYRDAQARRAAANPPPEESAGNCESGLPDSKS